MWGLNAYRKKLISLITFSRFSPVCHQIIASSGMDGWSQRRY
ncbi:hypothetical protein [Coxiella-like endosymbiont]|nr:hypothetical protein [Coxiella-like endosymbiont]